MARVTTGITSSHIPALGAALQSVIGFMRENDCDVQDAIAMTMGIIFETYSTPDKEDMH